jgi:glutamyl-Q tRNA(Asp) synthetase
LDAFGLHWDGAVYYQSQHLADYQACLDELAQRDLTYRCICSRKSLAELTNADSANSGVYPGICRNRAITENIQHAIRLKTATQPITFKDGLQGVLTSNLAAQHGDFILKRKDGITAYQLAVVIDDHLQQVNHVVRGCDLLAETPKQIYLQGLLGLAVPDYKHVPVIVDSEGYKLSKQTLATAVTVNNPASTLLALLRLLKQNLPDCLNNATVNEILKWAILNWRADDLVSLFSVR